MAPHWLQCLGGVSHFLHRGADVGVGPTPRYDYAVFAVARARSMGGLLNLDPELDRGRRWVDVFRLALTAMPVVALAGKRTEGNP